jgi:hypothetical protein
MTLSSQSNRCRQSANSGSDDENFQALGRSRYNRFAFIAHFLDNGNKVIEMREGK